MYQHYPFIMIVNLAPKGSSKMRKEKILAKIALLVGRIMVQAGRIAKRVSPVKKKHFRTWAQIHCVLNVRLRNTRIREACSAKIALLVGGMMIQAGRIANLVATANMSATENFPEG